MIVYMDFTRIFRKFNQKNITKLKTLYEFTCFSQKFKKNTCNFEVNKV